MATGETTSLTQVEEDVHLAASILMFIKYPPRDQYINDEIVSCKRKDADQIQKPKKKVKKQDMMKISMEEKFSEETRRIIEEWYRAEPDPREIFNDAEVRRQFSKPIKKQLMSSDVKKDQSRLMLPKEQVEETMLSFLKESEDPRAGIDVSVYGPDGEVQDMKFKVWNGNKTPVLTSGWKEFVAKYDLNSISDFITVWMFRDIKTQKICFAINCIRFPLM